MAQCLESCYTGINEKRVTTGRVAVDPTAVHGQPAVRESRGRFAVIDGSRAGGMAFVPLHLMRNLLKGALVAIGRGRPRVCQPKRE